MTSRDHQPPDEPIEPDDLELVTRARQKDTEAYNELIRRHHARIYGLVYHMTSSREDAEDLTQDVFFRAYAALDKFKGDASFYTWIYRIAVNRAISFIKSRKRRTAVSLDDMDGAVERDPAMVELATAGMTPSRDTSLREFQEKLNAALQTLSDKHRTVVVMHDVQGIPHEEIAATLGVSCGTVRSRLFYARKMLQVELAEFAP